MRRYVLGIILLAMLPGCTSLNAFLDPNGKSALIGGQSIVATTANPIGPQEMAVIEGAYRAAIVGATQYRTTCYSKPIAELPTMCNNRRQVIRVFQSAYTRAKPVMADLRRFVKNNDQVSAKSVLIAAGQAIADMQDAVNKVGVQ